MACTASLPIGEKTYVTWHRLIHILSLAYLLSLL